MFFFSPYIIVLSVNIIVEFNLIKADIINYETKDASQQDFIKQSRCHDWLFARSHQAQLLQRPESTVDAKLYDVLERVGPDMKPASGFHDYEDISVNVSMRAWSLMQERVSYVADDKVTVTWPSIEQLLIKSNVSKSCLNAARQIADRAKALDVWATQLLNSWGSFPPSGLFEGSLGDIGSYHSCVNIPENKYVHHAHYCTIAFRPVMPNRRHYELIVKQEPEELLQLFNSSNLFSSLIGKAQYYHYVYFKLGTCFPIDCTPVDVQKFTHLIAKRWFFMSGPVKCHSRYQDDYSEIKLETNRTLVLSSKDLNDGIYIWKPHITSTQFFAIIFILIFTLLSVLFTLADLLLHRTPAIFAEYTNASKDEASRSQDRINHQTDGSVISSDCIFPNCNIDECLETNNNLSPKLFSPLDMAKTGEDEDQSIESPLYWAQLIKDCSIITNTQEFFTISKEQIQNDILCMNGLRCLTMSWIIIAHTMQYNDWSAFARIYEVETHLNSLFIQPLFNASYLVDTFFLISGLLTSYSVFRARIKPCKSNSVGVTGAEKELEPDEFKTILKRFSWKSYLIGRYLRLTPQILLVSMFFIILPLLSPTGGPHWYTMTGEYSENCAKNWWVNLFHIQAFYRSDEMCNFVCWWISVDMFYHIVALAVILIILNYGPKIVIRLSLAILLLNLVQEGSRHYQMNLPPNLFSTIPQTGAMWSDMTLKFFWTPIAHVFPFLFGFFTGYHLAATKSSRYSCKNWFTIRRAIIGWLISISSIILVLYGTYFWVTGRAHYSRLMSTCFYLTTQMVWSVSVSWIIVACEFGFGSFIASILSCKLFLVLGRASYLVYLSHFLVLFTFFGSQNLLVEPTQLMITYIVIGNICISMLFGSILCITFEMPWLKLQRRIMNKIK